MNAPGFTSSSNRPMTQTDSDDGTNTIEPGFFYNIQTACRRSACL